MSDLDHAELTLIDMYRAETDALARLMRWHLELLDAGLSPSEAEAICAFCRREMAGENDQKEAA